MSGADSSLDGGVAISRALEGITGPKGCLFGPSAPLFDPDDIITGKPRWTTPMLQLRLAYSGSPGRQGSCFDNRDRKPS